MFLILAVLVILAASLGVTMKFLLGWFARLDEESRTTFSEPFLDDPTSLKQVPCPSVFSEPSKTLSIVIPAYNEEDRLPATLTETLSYLQRRRDRQGAYFTYEVIVVDDGSKDGTVKTAFGFVRRHGLDAVRVLRLPRNRGKGAAVRCGCLSARGRSLLFMDADGATRVSDMERLEEKLAAISHEDTAGGGAERDATTEAAGGNGSIAAGAAGGATLQQRRNSQWWSWGGGGRKVAATVPAVRGGSVLVGRGEGLGLVLGSRAHLQDAAAAKRSAVRNFLMHGFHFLVTMVVGGQIRDTQCGFKLMTRRTAQQLYSNQRLQRWCFDVELVYLAQQLKVPMAEVGVTWTEVPGSKIRPSSIIHMAAELAAIKTGYGLGLWRVRGEEELSKAQ